MLLVVTTGFAQTLPLDFEDPLDDNFVETSDYLYAGERGWLGNIDAIQLEFSKLYRDFDKNSSGIYN